MGNKIICKKCGKEILPLTIIDGELHEGHIGIIPFDGTGEYHIRCPKDFKDVND